MDIGLLWYDDDPRRGLEDKVGRAAQRYRDKYGRWPNTCFVHPNMLTNHLGQDLRVACSGRQSRSQIRVISAPNILLHHYWLGESSGRKSKTRKVSAA
jgi:hypothetical protein